MATTTVTHAVDPTETPYVFGSVPLTETGVLVVQIYGYGCLAGLIILMLSTFIYCTFIKPHKLRAAKAAAAMDIENLKSPSGAKVKGSPSKSGKEWASDSTVTLSPPPKAKAYKKWRTREPEPLTNGSFR